MPLQKQSLSINFSKGLDTKSDPFQIAPGNFLSLENSIFDKGGLLQKRNGFLELTSLPNDSSSYLTTFHDNLMAIGTSVNAYNSNSASWVSRGTYQPVQLSTLPLVRNAVNQIQTDSAISTNGLVCTVYTEVNASGTTYKYTIEDSVTGQAIIVPTLIPVASGVVTGSPRIFFLGQYFILIFTNVISSTSHLQYVAINQNNPSVAGTNTDIASAYVSSTTLSWDGYVSNENLYVAYNTTTGGQAIKVTYLTSQLTLVAAKTFSGSIATIMSVTADLSSLNVYISFWDAAGSTGHTIILDKNLNTILAATSFLASGNVLNLASAAQNGVVTIFYENANNYSYDSAIPTHFISSKTLTNSGTLGSAIVVIRSLGLASKAFILNGVIYFLGAFQSPFQNTYFLMNGSSSTSANPQIVAKLAYENGGGYLTLGLPSVTFSSGNASLSYLFKDLIEALSTVANSQQTTSGGIYSQTGINLVTFNLGDSGIETAEIGSDLLISGGFLWSYDGVLPVENNFFLWPDSIEVTTVTSGGHLADQIYLYQVTYEWADNQGNIFRSAPSIPVTITTTGGGNSTNTINIPTLRLTYKNANNPVKIVIYRWSTMNQNYFQVTSISLPTLNSTTTDSIVYSDTLADSSIVGNNLIYTTGGVVEDINGPASNIFTLFDTRFWMVDSEDRNLIWFSKQVIEGTPVEMSDLFTFYLPPTTGAQGSTGDITAFAPMDDKLIIFKPNAIYYVNGIGPDNTGANNGYSQPIFITSTVGCANPKSVVFQPNGLMFQSDKGIWILNRNLSTEYIGAPVEAFNSSNVESAVAIPSTNQVRFTLDSGTTLMYDYYYGQWGTFVNIPAISSTIFESLHTFINDFGQVFQENPGSYLDGSNPVLMSFQTGWFNLAGLQGYERIYDLYLLGTYYSPHKLAVSIAYDYSPAASHQSIISPNNYNPAYGVDSDWGTLSPYGGIPRLEEFRIHMQRQTCSAFQITLNEIFDSSYGVPAGVGLTLSNMNLRLGIKKGVRPIRAANSVG